MQQDISRRRFIKISGISGCAAALFGSALLTEVTEPVADVRSPFGRYATFSHPHLLHEPHVIVDIAQVPVNHPNRAHVQRDVHRSIDELFAYFRDIHIVDQHYDPAAERVWRERKDYVFGPTGTHLRDSVFEDALLRERSRLGGALTAAVAYDLPLSSLDQLSSVVHRHHITAVSARSPVHKEAEALGIPYVRVMPHSIDLRRA